MSGTGQTVYIVTSGEYSDYRIDTVFDSRELAEDYVAKCGERVTQIEEYEVNKDVDLLKSERIPYNVYVDKDGRITSCLVAWLDHGSGLFTEGYKVERSRMVVQGVCHSWLRAQVYARDKEHAKKIAAEKHAQARASGEWPD